MVNDEGVAWFFMSEGYLTLEIRRDKKRGIGYRMYPVLRIFNTDSALIDVLEEWFRENQIPYCEKNSVGVNKPCLSVQTQCISVKTVLDRIYPYLVGEKKNIANLIYRYFEDVWLSPKRPEKYRSADRGRFLTGVKIHDEICAINTGKDRSHRNRKYDVAYFEKVFYQPNPEMFKPS